MKKTSPQKVPKKLWQSLEYPEWATVSLAEHGPLPRTRVYEEIDFFGLKKKEWRQMRPKKFSRDPEKQREYLVKEIRQLYKKDERELLTITFSRSDFRIWLPEPAKK